MKKICRICGKPIKGSVLDHYEDKHFSFYIANQSKIESHPSAFAVSEDSLLKNAGKPEIKEEIVIVEKEEMYEEIQPAFDVESKKYIIDILEENSYEQTYRRKYDFECNGCHEMHKYGKVISGKSHKLHLCYNCYKYAKMFTESKRGNKHVFINTPM